MPVYSFADSSGRFLSVHDLREDDLPLWDMTGAVAGFADGRTHYASGGVAVARPILTPPPLTVGEEWVTGAPEGTAVVVDGVEVGTLGSDEPIAFDTPGTYRVELFPWLPVDVVVT